MGAAELDQAVRDIETKLRFVLNYATNRGQGAEAEAKMIATQPELIIRSVPGLTEQELLGLFSSFVMPMN